MKWYIPLLSLIAIIIAGSLSGANVSTQTLSITEGKGRTIVLRLRVRRYGSTGPVFFAPHDNERTGRAAAHKAARRMKGIVVEVKTGGRRNASFVHNGVRYGFDPNRMFTPGGLRRSIRRISGKSSPQMVRKLNAAIRKQIVHRYILLRPFVVALHNNRDKGYSIGSYLPGGRYERDAADAHLNPKHDIDDFFFVTTRGFFNIARIRNFNVVLQSAGAANDGSLSVYCQRNGIPYVNVETQHGHGSTFARMMRVVQTMR